MTNKKNTTTHNVTTKVTGKRSRGRPALINDKAFIEVHNKSESVDDIVTAFKTLRKMDAEKARVYVSIRAHNLRAAGHDLKMFKRGRKPSVVA